MWQLSSSLPVRLTDFALFHVLSGECHCCYCSSFWLVFCSLIITLSTLCVCIGTDCDYDLDTVAAVCPLNCDSDTDTSICAGSWSQC